MESLLAVGLVFAMAVFLLVAFLSVALDLCSRVATHPMLLEDHRGRVDSGIVEEHGDREDVSVNR